LLIAQDFSAIFEMSMKTLLHFRNSLLYIFLVLSMWSCATKESKAPVTTEKNSDHDRDKLPQVYIGEAFYLPETEEFYTPLFFHPDYDEGQSPSLISLADSTVFARKRMKRKRIPMPLAKSTFMLAGLDTLFIYDMRHTLISKASLLRVEHFEDGSEGKFVAVFKGEKPETDPAERYYCTNDLLKENYMTDFAYNIVNDQSLNRFIIHRLKRDQHVNWDIINIEVLPGRITYSIVNSRSESFITELNNSEFNVVINMNRGYRIEHILPLPFEFNNRPLMFISVYNEKERSRETSLAAFADYQEYKFLRYNRILIK
jgi:hypothetical protein